MATRTATAPALVYEVGPYTVELWNYTGTFVAGTDSLAAVTPQRIKKIVAVRGNFTGYSASGNTYTFTFDASTSKPSVEFLGYGR